MTLENVLATLEKLNDTFYSEDCPAEVETMWHCLFHKALELGYKPCTAA